VALAAWSARQSAWSLGPEEVVVLALGAALLVMSAVLSDLFRDVRRWLSDRGQRAHRASAVLIALVTSITASYGVSQHWPLWFWVNAIAWTVLGWWFFDRWVEREVLARERLARKRRDMSRLLDKVAACLEQDYPGTLPSVNLMVPTSHDTLEVHSCTDDMLWSGMAGTAWRKGVGCVGRLWQANGDIACAILRGSESHADYGLTGREAMLHKDVTCVLSVAVRYGVGEEQELLGFLNVHSASPEAPGQWIVVREVEGEAVADVAPQMKDFLIQTVMWIAKELGSQ